ncbi:hypothetical protein GYA93_02375, partial [Gordonia desulfuricans]|nr:hypothetical protein [Gordonia desulfuricans]
MRSHPRNVCAGRRRPGCRSSVRSFLIGRMEMGGRVTYTLTGMGRELSDVVDALGTWGTRWIGELGDADLDP